jgi:calcineurin-like phosphoesterase family protein
MLRRYLDPFVISLALVAGSLGLATAQDITLPNRPDTLKFAVIGDSGTGSSSQYQIAKQLWASHAKYPYEFVVMMGDNLYGGNRDKDFQKKFEDPYRPILDAKIKFYASLGNHDNPNERLYKLFNMNGERFYTFSPKPGVRFFALDSNYMDKVELQWLEKELAASGADWKIAFFHHPLYSSGGAHGSDLQLRGLLEPIFLKYGVDLVLTGHEHFYERIKPQKGIYYFISGGAAKLREGDVGPRSELTAKGFDSGYHFMLMELDKNAVHFQVITDQGKTVDSGTLMRFDDQQKKKLAAPVIGPR